MPVRRISPPIRRQLVLALLAGASLAASGVFLASAAAAHLTGKSAPAPPGLGASPTPECGPGWRVVVSPSSDGGDNSLKGVADVSASDLWAVGSVGPVGARQTLAEHWDGVRWSIVPSPNVPGLDNRLQAVAAISPGDVWAVGMAGDQTLILHWSGA